VPSGGARTRSGPPPELNALRRDRDSGDWTTLPEEGRTGPVPEWPLPNKASQPEMAMWKGLWAMPQALMWDRQRQHHEVALYVRKFIEASRPKAPAMLTTATQRMADSLGLTVPGLLRNRWKIGTSEVTRTQAPRRTASSRERFKVVDGGA
jgi:hypothetical protein